jgi:hypothetical protein
MDVKDTEPEARKMFQSFHAKPSKRRIEFDFGWPSEVQEIGQAKAQMYRSNKWQSNPKETEDYKHIAEAPQQCFVVPGFLRDFETNKPLAVYGEVFELDSPMPEHITILAPLIGIQVRLLDKRGRLSQGEEGLYEIVVPGGMLAGANDPKSGDPFLVVYTKKGGVHMIITGDKLNVEKDGIVG